MQMTLLAQPKAKEKRTPCSNPSIFKSGLMWQTRDPLEEKEKERKKKKQKPPDIHPTHEGYDYDTSD